MEFHFLTVEHAANSVELGSRLLPCKVCVAKLMEVLTREPH